MEAPRETAAGAPAAAPTISRQAPSPAEQASDRPRRPSRPVDVYATRRVAEGQAAEGLLRAAATADRAAAGAPASDLARRVPSWAEQLEDPATRTRRKIQRAIDDAIERAMAQGEFANLRGKGKPLPPEVLWPADDRWMASKTLANSGFLPPWLQLRQEIDAELAECCRLVERAERYPPLVNREQPVFDLQQRLEVVRDKARRYNLMVPSLSLQRSLPRTDELLQRMRRAVSPESARPQSVPESP